ncbi:uncharacterized protein LOC119091782 isoform X2 [Pollicipes pollicipes]|uniref:uncharacterized protein LOC119091782 isoform X2 n=1 Tax=Pollicipes pollicipes TaxID=41117 RepID=UPI00188582D9|nr:uncharacterized protein LOC119091782 isoform X2 [Pollicipes pollicipes]
MSFLENSSHSVLLDCSDQESSMKGSTVAWAGADLLDPGSDGADFDISSFFNQLTAATPAPDPGSVPGSGPGPPGSSQLMDRTCVAAELNEGLSAVDQHTVGELCAADGELCAAAAEASAADLSALLGEHAELQEALLAATEPAPPPGKTFVVVKKQQRGSRRPGVGRPKRTPPEYGDPPPAPLSAYNLFAKEQYPRLKARWRGLNVRRAGPKLSSLWAGLSPAERGVYQERAYQQKEQYRQQLTDYRRRARLWRRRQAQAEGDGDSTDQPEVHSDDDRNDLYCRLCDAYFSSSHNKEQHLHSRQHVRAISLQAAEWPAASADSEDERPDSPLEPPADVSGALEDVLHQTVRREQEIRCLTEARAQLGEQQRQLRQLADELEVRHDRAAMDLESETSHSRRLTDQLENLLLVPTLFGVMSQWSCDAQPGGVS